ncbi:hypothetical protein LAZ67_5001979 [Cordylochernes scorpioides]|uniref:DUF7041 domain-containing protein n=1 Tax=Cordylochernes scorpioides TaxID=51811 RepID=A0ABY6KG05_9ARAC|nr:hypothetical protein LAZ67_5001979 [Cordylochernes scorpioides]
MIPKVRMPLNFDEGAQHSAESEAEAAKVAVKISPFWSDRPEIWFYQVEAQFAINGISQEMRAKKRNLEGYLLG